MKEIIIAIEVSVNRREVRICRGKKKYNSELSHTCGLREISQVPNTI